jgi:hypothetical protein
MAKEEKPEYVTKELLNDAVDTLLKGMGNLYERFKGELNSQLEN